VSASLFETLAYSRNKQCTGGRINSLRHGRYGRVATYASLLASPSHPPPYLFDFPLFRSLRVCCSSSEFSEFKPFLLLSCARGIYCIDIHGRSFVLCTLSLTNLQNHKQPPPPECSVSLLFFNQKTHSFVRDKETIRELYENVCQDDFGCFGCRHHRRACLRRCCMSTLKSFDADTNQEYRNPWESTHTSAQHRTTVLPSALPLPWSGTPTIPTSLPS
jgi:hypothetical protein